ncbi:hypothetical protein [Emticicia sp. 21SJ11W-3]|uniref:hypothetical protein n=1 Tax=Emticicia sp. 21SJ11W-3 TaxID=2916755 RepID=UPI00209E9C87|nr:hypothetical protein [Emticicia sp. 21SJ11W-3]UTA67240.1 hypothetical protein MB380_16725 [Emticicia sp. 21SJ11W-3]
MDFTLGLYRFSGWSQDVIWLLICWMMLKKGGYWTGHKMFFLLYALSTAFFEIVYAITAITLSNNLFLDYWFIALEFVVLSFYLRGVIKLKWINVTVYILCLAFVGFSVYNSFLGQGFNNYNSYGTLINSLYLTFLSGLGLFMLAKRYINKRLFSLTESWLVLGVFLIYSSIIIFDYIYALSVPYKNDTILYAVLIVQNFIKSFFLIFYIKGIMLIK